MSIFFDPNRQIPVQPPENQPKKKLGLWFKKWIDSIYEGSQQEINSVETYCLKEWHLKEKDVSSPDFLKHMEECSRSCHAYQIFVRWYRLN